MPKIGDTVRYLNDVGGGVIVKIKDNMAWVDDDGFETPVLLRECVVVRTAEQNKTDGAKASAPTPVTPKVDVEVRDTHAPAEPPVEETPQGNRLNITLGFEPAERARLTETDFDASLVNDSNYYLYFVIATRDEFNDTGWKAHYAGTVEPNTELWLGTWSRSDIATMDRLAFQYVAFKNRSEYELKNPGNVEIKIDTTKFFKLHCFRPHRYFEADVLAFDLVKDDSSASDLEPNTRKLVQSLSTVPTQKTSLPKKARHHQKTQPITEPLVVDLHIDELLDNTRGMSAADILNYQVDSFRKAMDDNLPNYGRKIVFIHGKGDGVLRQALAKELANRYKGHDVQDASFAEYGYGATQVTVRQHPELFTAKTRRR